MYAALQGRDRSDATRFVQLAVAGVALAGQLATVVVFVLCITSARRVPEIVQPDYALYEDVSSPARALLPKRQGGSDKVAELLRVGSDAGSIWPTCATDFAGTTTPLPLQLPVWMLPEDDSGMLSYMAAQVRRHTCHHTHLAYMKCSW